MTRLNKAQITALHSVYMRCPTYGKDNRNYGIDWSIAKLTMDHGRPNTYREFRKTVQAACYDDCVMLPWCGMWLGIEKDGYCHS